MINIDKIIGKIHIVTRMWAGNLSYMISKMMQYQLSPKRVVNVSVAGIYTTGLLSKTTLLNTFHEKQFSMRNQDCRCYDS